jgi:hypothetical protein
MNFTALYPNVSETAIETAIRNANRAEEAGYRVERINWIDGGATFPIIKAPAHETEKIVR